MKIIITSGRRRPTPFPGDRRVTKKHGMQIRVWDMACGTNGDPIGRVVSGSRPCFTWMSPGDLAPWDRHYLTPEELAHHFPPEREAGYMQMRGAA